jgi:hypothetical protein
MNYTIEYQEAKGKTFWAYCKTKADALKLAKILKSVERVSYVHVLNKDLNTIQEWQSEERE